MVIGYIRVSTEQQDVRNQRHEILEYSNGERRGKTKNREGESDSRKASQPSPPYLFVTTAKREGWHRLLIVSALFRARTRILIITV